MFFEIPDNLNSTLAMTSDTLSNSTPRFYPCFCCNSAVTTVTNLCGKSVRIFLPSGSFMESLFFMGQAGTWGGFKPVMSMYFDSIFYSP